MYNFYAQVTEDDLLPTNVCTSCVSKLEICHELVINCLDADARLRTILGFDVMPTEEVQISSFQKYIREQSTPVELFITICYHKGFRKNIIVIFYLNQNITT